MMLRFAQLCACTRGQVGARARARTRAHGPSPRTVNRGRSPSESEARRITKDPGTPEDGIGGLLEPGAACKPGPPRVHVSQSLLGDRRAQHGAPWTRRPPLPSSGPRPLRTSDRKASILAGNRQQAGLTGSRSPAGMGCSRTRRCRRNSGTPGARRPHCSPGCAPRCPNTGAPNSSRACARLAQRCTATPGN